MSPSRAPWHQRMSLRARLVLLAAVVLVMVVSLGGALIVLAVRAELIDSTDEVAEARAEQVAELAELGVLPEDLVGADDIESAVQVVRGGRVVSASENATRVFTNVPQQPPGSDDVVQVDRLPIDDDGPFRVTALGTRTPQGDATVFVAIAIDGIDDAASALMRIGAVGMALLVVAVSGVFWVVIGRALKPVDAIRQRAELITSQHLDQRVPEPLAQDEIHRLARTINDMLARLQSSALKQERFVADAAHEMRTPLATLRARLEATSGAHSGSDEELVPDILHETMRLTALVDHLLLLARSDAGMAAPVCAPSSLGRRGEGRRLILRQR